MPDNQQKENENCNNKKDNNNPKNENFINIEDDKYENSDIDMKEEDESKKFLQ